MKNTQPTEQSFSVPFSYPVIFTRDLFGTRTSHLEDALSCTSSNYCPDVLCFLDEGLTKAQPGLTTRIEAWFKNRPGLFNLVRSPVTLIGGEMVKNDYRLTMNMVDTMLEHRLCRHSIVLVAGGGAVLDAVGFAASIVHRGLRVVRLPSTTLAQCDAGLGVKNGMNLHGGKNIVGTFHPPHAVINDLDLLDSLSQEDWIAGISEAFKVALIKDADFFDDLCQSANDLRLRDREAMERVVRRCGDLHLEHIRSSGDPFELGTARPLDFGHWSAHKLESMSNYRVSHGHAVAIGLALDMLYASKQGWVSPDACEQALQGLENCGFCLWLPEMGRQLGDARYEILQGLEEFREHLGGNLCLTFPDGIGEKREADKVDHKLMAQALAQLMKRYNCLSSSKHED